MGTLSRPNAETYERVPTPIFSVYLECSTHGQSLVTLHPLCKLTVYNAQVMFGPLSQTNVHCVILGQPLQYNSLTIIHSCEKPVGVGLGQSNKIHCFLSLPASKKPATSNFLIEFKGHCACPLAHCTQEATIVAQ